MAIDFSALSFWIGVGSLFLGVIGIGLTTFFYMSRMNKTMESLLERQKGILTLEQAKKITEFHLRDIKTVLDRALVEFCSRIIPTTHATKNLDVVRRELLNLAETSIVPSRNSISIFLLRGEVRMDTFMETVNPLNSGLIQGVVEQMLCSIDDIFSTMTDDDEIEAISQAVQSKISLMADETIRDAKARLNSELDQLYSG